jgi:hypothetical protein
MSMIERNQCFAVLAVFRYYEYSVSFHGTLHVVMYISERRVSIAEFDNVVHMHICLSNRWRNCINNTKISMLMFIFWVPFLETEAIKFLSLGSHLEL